MIDALDTLYIMELEEEFQEAKQWVEKSFDLNVVSQLLGMSACVTQSDHNPPQELCGDRNHSADPFLPKAKGNSGDFTPNLCWFQQGPPDQPHENKVQC